MEKQPPLRHRAELRELTRLEFVSPHAGRPSPELAAVANTGLVRLRAGHEYLVVLGFDGESRGDQADLRPLLPLLLNW